MASYSNNLQIFNDEEGRVVKIKHRVSSNKHIIAKVWDAKVFIHMEDTSKCWENGSFNLDKTKTVSYKWEQIADLKRALTEMEPAVQQMLIEQDDMTLMTAADEEERIQTPKPIPAVTQQSAPLKRKLFRPPPPSGVGRGRPLPRR